MIFSCKKCGVGLGEMGKGKIRKGAVLLCKECWRLAETAIEIAEQAQRDMPDFMKGLFK